MSNFNDPPAFASGDADNLGGLITKLNQLREVVQTIIGTRGPNRGSTAWKADALTDSGSGGTTIIGGGGGTGGSPDLTPPPTPTGFAAGAAISHIFVTCDNQAYTQGGGHLYSHVYGATYDPIAGGPLPTFSSAVLIDTFSGTIEAIAENPSTQWHLWLKWVTHALVESVAPAGGTNGLTVTTGQDVSALLTALTGEITQSQLFAALSTRIDLIDASAATPGSVNARVATEATSRAAADSSLATSISTVSASTATNATAITSETTARSSADTALGTRIDTVVAVANGVASGLTNFCVNPGFVPGSGGWPNIPFLARTAGGVPANAPSSYVGRWNSRDGAMSVPIAVTPGEILDCSVWVASNSATINRVGLLSYALDSSGTIVSDPPLTSLPSGITGWTLLSGSYTVAAGVVSIQPLLWIEQAFVGGPDTVYYAQPTVMRRAGSAIQSIAAVQTEATSRASADAAIASSVTTLTATVGANTTAISTETTARSSADGQLYSQYTVKIDSNGYVSGFGLASTSTGAAPTSTFAIRADSFYIASPSGPSPVAPAIPFIVRTSATTINGRSVPAGVYMTNAFIANGTITQAMIGLLQVDDALIASANVAKLTAGTLQVGAYIRSTSYVANSAGWTINADGTAEFGFAMIRGTLSAAQIAATSIDASKLNVTSLSAITASIGLLRTGSSGQRVEISDNRIRVYDPSNVLRIKLGDLS